MARSTAREGDFIPHMPELLFSVSTCWRAIRDAQTEVDPFGRSFEALGAARASLEALAHDCTGQAGVLSLADVGRPAISRSAEDCAGAPF